MPRTLELEMEEKKVQEKENLAQAIMIYCPWQNEQQMRAGLMKFKFKTSKLQAQLEFRRKVLEQNQADKSIFCLSKNRRKLSVDEVCGKLCKPFQPSNSGSDKEGLIGKRIKHRIMEC